METSWGILAAIAGVVGVLISLIALFGSSSEPSSSRDSTDDANPTSQLDPAAASSGSTVGKNLPTIRNSGTLSLALYTRADLDSLPSDPQWGINTFGADIKNGVGLNLGFRAVRLKVPGGDYSTCHSTTGYGEVNISRVAAEVGTTYCVKTDGDRYSIVSILEVEGHTTKLSVITYDPPFDS